MSSPVSHASASGFLGMTELPPLPSSSSLSLPPASGSPSPLLLFGKYILLRKLGSGSFGDIYLGLNIGSGGHVAVKLEAQDMRWKQLCFESRLYSYLQGKPGIPKVYEFGDYYPYYVLVMELLGPSLEDLFNLCNRRFTVRCVCLVAEQLLQRIELFHSKSFLHRDIKPDNFLVASDPIDSTIYMIDYGLAKKYRDMRTHQHFPYQENRDLTGTVRYTSINAHLGIEQSRRDDLESLGYVMLYFLRGSLPWQGMKASSKRDKYQKISVCKMSTSNEQLCAGQPDEFVLYLNYTRALQFDSKPDYAYLRGLFKDLLLRKGWQHDSKYDWSGKRTVAAMAGLDVPTVPRPLLTTEISQLPPTNSHDARQQQRHPHSHSHNQSSPVSAASPQQPLSSSPPLSLSQQRASVYGTETTHPSPRDSSPRQLSPFYPPQHQPQQQPQRMQHQQQPSQQQQQQQVAASPHTGSNNIQNGVEPSRLSSHYDVVQNSFSPGMVGQSTVYQLSTLPATASPLPVPLLHHVPALNFSHSSSLSSMNPGGGFKSLPAAFPPLLLSPLPAPQPFAGMSSLPFVPSTLSLPSHSQLQANFAHSPYAVNPLSPSTFASHPFFSPSLSPSSTTAATMGDGSSRISSTLPPHSISSSSSSPLSIHHTHSQSHHTTHPSLSPSSYSNTHSRSSLSSPLASPHFSSSSASPYLTSSSSTLSLSASPLHASNHNHAQLSSPPMYQPCKPNGLH